jgi:nicotinamidase-related amidase
MTMDSARTFARRLPDFSLLTMFLLLVACCSATDGPASPDVLAAPAAAIADARSSAVEPRDLAGGGLATASGTALLLIDIQEFYFPGGALPLQGPEAAADQAARLLARFRQDGELIMHVRHEAASQGDIHPTVAPHDGEMVITKRYANAFRDTDLLQILREHQIERLVICGMQTHMCVEAATRAAADLGFQVILVGDACATRDLAYGGRTVAAADVHASTLASLQRTYAEVMSTEEFLAR